MPRPWCFAVVLLLGSAPDARPAGKAPPPPKPVTVQPAEFDVEFGASVMSDYIYRGFSITDRKPTVQGYSRAVYRGFYAGVIATAIDVPFAAPAVLDFHAGVRQAFGPILWEARANYYHFPDSVIPTTTIPSRFDYWEVQTRPIWVVNEAMQLMVHAAYSPNFINLGASETWLSGIAVLKGPLQALPGWGAYFSAELGQRWMGTNNAGVNLPDYLTWNVGGGLAYGPLTFDLRYYDSELSREECWILTGDLGAAPGGTPSPANPFGLRSNWCGAAVVGKVAVDLTFSKLGLFSRSR